MLDYLIVRFKSGTEKARKNLPNAGDLPRTCYCFESNDPITFKSQASFVSIWISTNQTGRGSGRISHALVVDFSFRRSHNLGALKIRTDALDTTDFDILVMRVLHLFLRVG
jgi:hypothetical protein